MNYGRAIKTLCAAREMTQQDLARAMDVNEAFVSRLLSNEHSPRMATLEKVADVLDAPLFVLVLLASDKRDLPTVVGQRAALGLVVLETIVTAARTGSASRS